MTSNIQRGFLANAGAAIFKQAAVSSILPSALSVAALVLRGKRETGTAAAPLNAPSHWLFGREALRANRPSWRHTASGVLIHHGSSMLWGAVYSHFFCKRGKKRSVAELGAGAIGVTAVAALVDFKLVPSRLTPGFEHRLSRQSLWLTYGSFAAGLALTGILYSRRQ